LGNLVFGTRDVRIRDSLKSSAGLSEKHEADGPAEIAARQLLRDIAAGCYRMTQPVSVNGDVSIRIVGVGHQLCGRLAGKTLWRVEVFMKK
jgi:hypothetical protein